MLIGLIKIIYSYSLCGVAKETLLQRKLLIYLTDWLELALTLTWITDLPNIIIRKLVTWITDLPKFIKRKLVLLIFSVKINKKINIFTRLKPT